MAGVSVPCGPVDVGRALPQDRVENAVKSAVEPLEPTRVKLTVEVTYPELEPRVRAAYTSIAQQVSVPGFRKGKAPARIIDQRVGRAAVIEQAVNDALPDFYRQAVAESEIRPLGQPDVEVTGVPSLTEAGGELVFTAEVDIRPEITLPDLAGITLVLPSVEVTEGDVDDAVLALRERFGTLVGVDRPAADGDFVVLDLSATIDDEEIDSVSGISYQIGTGTMLPGLDEALTGLAAGETATFEAPLAGGEHAGEDARVTVTATAVKQRDLPEVDDDFAQLASEFDTVAELREGLRAQAADGKRSGQAGEARSALLAALLERVDIPVPARVIEAEVDHHLEEEGRSEDDAHREEVRAEAADTLRRQLVLDALAERMAVSVGQQELLDFLVRTSQQYETDPSTFIGNADQAGQIPVFVAELARSKAVVGALREVTVVDDAGAPVDLDELLGPVESGGGAEDAGDDTSGESADDDVQDTSVATPASTD